MDHKTESICYTKNGIKVYVGFTDYTQLDMHREDGPALIRWDGTFAWYINGKAHKDDGPAVLYSDGTYKWYINNINKSEEIEKWIKENNIPHWSKWNNNMKILFKLMWC